MEDNWSRELQSRIQELEHFFASTKRDSHWEGLSSCPYSTSFTLLGLNVVQREITRFRDRIDKAIIRSLHYLINSQNHNGSWGENNQLLERFWITPHVILSLKVILREMERNNHFPGKNLQLRLKKVIYRGHSFCRRTAKYVASLGIDKTLINLNLYSVKQWAHFFQVDVPLPTGVTDDISFYEELIQQSWITRVADLPPIDYFLPHVLTREDMEKFQELWIQRLSNGSFACIVHHTALMLMGRILLGNFDVLLDVKPSLNFLLQSQNSFDGGFPEFFNYETFITVYPAWLLSLTTKIHNLPLPHFLQDTSVWTIKQQNPDGTWSFTKDFPKGDMDDTSCAIGWLLESGALSRDHHAIKRAFKRLNDFISDQGGVSSWPTISVPEIDVTAHALAAFGMLDRSEEFIGNCLSYFRKTQRNDGSWLPSWHLSPVYGTSQVIIAVNRLNLEFDEIVKAENYLTNFIQQLDESEQDPPVEDLALASLALINSPRRKWYADPIQTAIQRLIGAPLTALVEKIPKNWIAVYTYSTSTFQPSAVLSLLLSSRLLLLR